jgi:hypothetical protein
VLHAWGTPDLRAPLRGDAVGAIVALMRAELVARAAGRRNFARAVIDRGLADLLAPLGDRPPRAKIAWPRGSEIALPGDAARLDKPAMRVFLHWEDPPGSRVDLDVSLAMFDGAWRHVATCDAASPVLGDRIAQHSGDLTSAPPPLGASELIDLDVDRLRALGVRHAVMAVFREGSMALDRLPHAFVGVAPAPPAPDPPFDPHAIAQRFDLHGKSAITVPLAIDLETRRLRWLDVHIKAHGALQAVGGYRAALAHIGRDFADLAATGARPTLWDVAAIHAVARANIVYVRERSGAITPYRRRDKEQALARLARLHAGDDPDGTVDELPPANAPTWFALLRDDLALPTGSAGYVLDRRAPLDGPDGIERLSAGDLLGELSR